MMGQAFIPMKYLVASYLQRAVKLSGEAWSFSHKNCGTLQTVNYFYAQQTWPLKILI